MAKQYRQLDSGLMVPDFPMRDRRRVDSSKGLIFAPGGGAAPGCHCPQFLCFVCTGILTPPPLIVDFPALTNNSCSNCADIGGEYQLDYDTGRTCVWSNSTGFDVCPDSRYVCLTFEGLGGAAVGIQLYATACGGGTYWQMYKDTISTPTDCTNLDITLSLFSATDGYCTASGTARVYTAP